MILHSHRGSSGRWELDRLVDSPVSSHSSSADCFLHFSCTAAPHLHPSTSTGNDILQTNINKNLNNASASDRVLVFEVLNKMERRLIEAGVVLPPVPKPGGPPQHVIYQRVDYVDWNRLGATIKGSTLENWAKGIVEECIITLSRPMRAL